MRYSTTAEADDDVARALVEEILRTGILLAGLLGDLIEALPEHAFPGENPAEVLLEMLVGTIRPAADAAGAPIVREATALIGALSERAQRDLEAAAELAARDR